MTQALSEVITHFIITYSGAHYAITARQNEVLRMAGPDDEFDVEGSLIKPRNISDIFTAQKYYQTFPDRRPVSYSYPNGAPQEFTPMTPRRRISALEGLLSGLDKYINGKFCRKTPQVYKMRDRIVARIENAKSSIGQDYQETDEISINELAKIF